MHYRIKKGTTVGVARLSKGNLHALAFCGVLGTSVLLAGCLGGGGGSDDDTSVAQPTTLNCDDSIAKNFKQDSAQLGGDTKVLLVKHFSKGDKLVLPDSTLPSSVAPLVASADVCLVKLVVGPGYTSEPSSAPSWSQGIGIEVWLPEKTAWNNIIRAYGSGGAGGGFHTDITKLGPNSGQGTASHVAAFGKGYVVSHSDGGHVGGTTGNLGGGTFTWAMKVDGTPNIVLWKDFSERSMHVQAITTKALAAAYYGKAHTYAYWDGQSTGGRQGYKLVQKYPTDFDGYLLGAPVVNNNHVTLSSLWPQVIMNAEFGGSMIPATKANFVSAQAVKACDTFGIGLITDPLACKYDPTKDAAALCNGVAGNGGVTGANTDGSTCISLAEATAFNKVWYGWTRDGHAADPAVDGNGMGSALAGNQLWYGITRGTNLTGISQAGVLPTAPALATMNAAGPQTLAADLVAVVLQNPAYGWTNFTNATGNGQSKYLELTYASFADVLDRALAMDDLYFSHYEANNNDLTAARDSNRKILHYHGWHDEVVPPGGSINYYQRVAGYMGGIAEVQKFDRLFMIPGYAHDSTFSRSGQIDPATKTPVFENVPLPQPATGRDELFSAIRNWVENGVAPSSIVVSSSNNSVSMPICMYPAKPAYNGSGDTKAAASYTCK